MKKEFVICKRHEEVAQAIADMVTQSERALYCCFHGIALAAYESRGMRENERLDYIERASYTLTHARPTTVAGMLDAVKNPLEAAKKQFEAVRMQRNWHLKQQSMI